MGTSTMVIRVRVTDLYPVRDDVGGVVVVVGLVARTNQGKLVATVIDACLELHTAPATTARMPGVKHTTTWLGSVRVVAVVCPEVGMHVLASR